LLVIIVVVVVVEVIVVVGVMQIDYLLSEILQTTSVLHFGFCQISDIICIKIYNEE
jgi:hypothetical protein